ncbi:MAG TPA: TetR/AcrR family transcriptional regulator [Candidatus Sulfotelmatobacter sp.]|nr:TetR/AcrR family transcriptional regulator [Candidatus Sulfotelmatobacter sp.]
MGLLERKLRQKQFLRQEILDAASELFVRDGYENVSMRRIAEKIEYSPTTIYLHFKDKTELLEQVCQETFARLSQILARIHEQSIDPVERIRRGLVAYIKFGLENPHHYRATFMMPVPEGLDHHHKNPETDSGMQAFDFLRRAVSGCIAAKKLRDVDPELVSQILWAGIHGLTSLLIVKCDHFPFVATDKLIHSMTDTLIAGSLLKKG